MWKFSISFDSSRLKWTAQIPKRSANNYFTGLFHDLPEVLTKDIISPVKRAATGLDRFVKDFEREEMERRIYGSELIPNAWNQRCGCLLKTSLSRR